MGKTESCMLRNVATHNVVIISMCIDFVPIAIPKQKKTLFFLSVCIFIHFLCGIRVYCASVQYTPSIYFVSYCTGFSGGQFNESLFTSLRMLRKQLQTRVRNKPFSASKLFCCRCNTHTHNTHTNNYQCFDSFLFLFVSLRPVVGADFKFHVVFYEFFLYFPISQCKRAHTNCAS